MNRICPIVLTALLSVPFSSAHAQSALSAAHASAPNEPVNEMTFSPSAPQPSGYAGPFTRFAIGGSVSPMGVSLKTTTNLGEHWNLRATGSLFNYSTTFTDSGFDASAKMRLGSSRLSADFYPFHKGFRLSPGVLLYNQNRVTASGDVAAGESFTLNDDTYYSAHANTATGATPIHGSAVLNLHARRPAFTMTAGWGNSLKRGNGHWSFPVEVGVAFVGAPKIQVDLGGWACQDQAETECSDISDPQGADVIDDLNAEIAKWTKDLEPLGTYPIVSAGVSYRFGHGMGRAR